MRQKAPSLTPPMGEEHRLAPACGRVGGRAVPVAFLALFILLAAPVFAAPKAVLFLSSIPTLAEAAQPDCPDLSGFLRRSGVAVMTVGPKETDPAASLMTGRYVPSRSPDDSRLREALSTSLASLPVWELVPSGNRWMLITGQRAGGMDAEGLDRQLRRAAGLHGVLIVNPRRDPSLVSPRPSAVQEDRLFGAVRKAFSGTPVIVASPRGPQSEGSPGHIPSWLAMSGPQGLLTSDTTRTPGVVSNLDVAPTLAAIAMGRKPRGAGGHVIRCEEGNSTVAGTARLQRALQVLAATGTPACAASAFLTLAALAAAILVPRGRGWPGLLVVSAVLAPAGIALSAGMRPQTDSGFVSWAIGATAALVVVASALGPLFARDEGDREGSVLYTALLLVALFLAADTAGQGMATRLSPLTALFQTGVRFYGMGNEYVALFIPAVLFVTSLTMERAGIGIPSVDAAATIGVVLAACAAFLGWRGAGANFGGMVTALVAGSALWVAVAQRAGWRSSRALAATASVAVAAVIVWLDASAATPTHIGAVARHGATPHGAAVGAIVRSKAAIAVKLIVSPVFLLAVASGLGLWRLTALRRAVSLAAAMHPWCGAAARAVVWGGLTAVVMNDTGPVMLALMLAAAALPMVFLARADHGLPAPDAGNFTGEASLS